MPPMLLSNSQVDRGLESFSHLEAKGNFVSEPLQVKGGEIVFPVPIEAV